MDFKTIHDVQDKELAFVASQTKKEKLHVPMPKLSRAKSSSFHHLMTAYETTKRRTRKTAEKIFMVNYFKDLNQAYGWKFILMVISVYGINQGIGESFIFLARSYYIFDILGMEPYKAQALSALMNVPWGMKPIYGLCSDLAPIFGLRRTPYIIIASVLGIIAMMMLGCVYVIPVYAAGLLFILSNYSMASPDVIIDGAITEAIQKMPLQASNLQSLAWGSFACCGFIASLCVGQTIDTVGPRNTFLIAIATLVPMGVFASFRFLNEKGGQRCGCNNVKDDDEFDLDFLDEFDANLYDEDLNVKQKPQKEANDEKTLQNMQNHDDHSTKQIKENGIMDEKKVLQLANNGARKIVNAVMSPRKNKNTNCSNGGHYTSVGSVDISDVDINLQETNGEEQKEDYSVGIGEDISPYKLSPQKRSYVEVDTSIQGAKNYSAPDSGRSYNSYLTNIDESRQKNIYILAVIVALSAVSSALSTNMLADYYKIQLAVTSGIAVVVCVSLYTLLAPVSPVIAKAAIFFLHD